jgi:nucleotide-binding universal stress UspA family protein
VPTTVATLADRTRRGRCDEPRLALDPRAVASGSVRRSQVLQYRALEAQATIASRAASVAGCDAVSRRHAFWVIHGAAGNHAKHVTTFTQSACRLSGIVMRTQQTNTRDRWHGRSEHDTTPAPVPHLIGVGVDGAPAGRDAVVLAAMLARATRAELMLIAIFEQPLLEGVVPAELGWTSVKEQARATLTRTRESFAPGARIAVRSNALAWRGLLHVARLEHRDLLVLGSTRRADYGQVGLGNVADELLSHLECPLAIAPRGMQDDAGAPLERIGVGFDATPESEAALSLAGAIALAAGADLRVRGVVDDRVAGRTSTADAVLGGDAIVARQLASLSERARAAALDTGAQAHVDAIPGAPADGLRELCDHVDLLVIGSGHGGTPGRVQLGSAGRTLLGDAPTPILIAPRPRHAATV